MIIIESVTFLNDVRLPPGTSRERYARAKPGDLRIIKVPGGVELTGGGRACFVPDANIIDACGIGDVDAAKAKP